MIWGAGDTRIKYFDGGFNYSYDKDGNLLRKTDIASGEVTIYEYNHRNLMTRATLHSKSPESGGVILAESTNRYDIDGRRIAFSVDDDGSGPLSPQQLGVIHNGRDTWADLTLSNTVKARYMFGSTIDQIIAKWQSDQAAVNPVHWYLTDHLKTIRDISDYNGIPISHTPYESFGRLLQPISSNNSDRFSFAGREYINDIAMYSLRARLLDPLSGRFASADPLSFNGGDDCDSPPLSDIGGGLNHAARTGA